MKAVTLRLEPPDYERLQAEAKRLGISPSTLARRYVRSGLSTSEVEALMRGWLEAGEDLHAPALLPYEAASGLTRLVVAGAPPPEQLADLWRALLAPPILQRQARITPLTVPVSGIATRSHLARAYAGAVLAVCDGDYRPDGYRCRCWLGDWPPRRDSPPLCG